MVPLGFASDVQEEDVKTGVEEIHRSQKHCFIPIFSYYYYYYYYYYLTAIGLTPSGSSTAHIYTQTVHRIQRTQPT
jgi:hypothetical protein